ncbi:hypothetical protein Val02_26940 [Virgisporangium aliadipatigenens]|uniref:Uncharacterized protein n=1 Tax=Virgisporangium aliadipatigenens TaxID=741659 RepID=A0A8J4DQK2_9ACTN|nr:AAA family ATPase [Virgisporangium aliadipatigenens]GIJ45808.1 hypothetical protein Val02_26940 [Virgisporangium aliadipatigenens]
MSAPTTVLPNLAELEWFVRLVYADAPPSSIFGYGSRVIGEVRGSWGSATSLDAYVAQLRALAECPGLDSVWHRNTTLRALPGAGERGKSVHSLSIPCLNLDGDIAGPRHKREPFNANGEPQDPLPASADEIRALFAETGLPEPSYWVDSGGGLNPYWLPDKPIPLATPEELAYGTKFAGRWHAVAHHVWQKNRRHLDTTRDLARVMRVPGSVNRKCVQEGVQEALCRVVGGGGRKYTYQELEDALTAAEARWNITGGRPFAYIPSQASSGGTALPWLTPPTSPPTAGGVPAAPVAADGSPLPAPPGLPAIPLVEDAERRFTMAEAEAFCAPTLEKLANSRHGHGRNNLLNDAACVMRRFRGSHWTDEQIVERLMGLAQQCGTLADKGEEQCLATIRSGLSTPADWMATRVPDAPPATAPGIPQQWTPGPQVDPVDALMAKMLDRDALDHVPLPKHLIRDVLALESECWCIGVPGGFKSFVALDWACHIATGLDWRGKPVHRGRVVYVAAEGRRGLPLRVKAWEATYGRRVEDVRFLPEPVQAGDPSAWSVLIEACRRLMPVLIVLDTQARITVGLEESSATAMGLFVEAVRKLKEATGACVLVVHHIGRNGEDARGSSALDGAQDTEIRVDRPTKKKERSALTATISMDKQKDDDETTRFPIQLDVVDLGTDPDTGRPLSSLALRPWNPFVDPTPVHTPDFVANLATAQHDALTALLDHGDEADGATRTELRAWINERRKEVDQKPIPKGTLASALVKLIDNGLVEKLSLNRVMATDLARQWTRPKSS